MRLSLRNRFLLPTIGLIILGMGVSAATSYIKAKATLESAITAQINQLSDSTMNLLSSWLEDRKRDIKYWSTEKAYQVAVQDSFVGQAARKTADARLADLKRDFKFYEEICIANPKGDVISASNPKIVNKINVADRENFIGAMKGQLMVTDVVKSRGTGNPVFMIAAPIKEKDQITGVLFGVIDVATFSNMFIDPVKIGQGGFAFIVNKDGLIIAHPDKSLIMKENISSYDGGKEMLAKGDGLMTLSWNGSERLMAQRKEKELGWILAIGAPTSEVFAPIKRLGYVNLTVAGSITLIAAIVMLLLVRSTVNPINRVIAGLGEAAEQVASGAREVASSSQQLAEGSSEQAAALEESSSSLEEMTSMTRQNANNAGHANALMKEAIQVVVKANGSMRQLTSSMQEISQASEETSKIIKTIDEIAFQTNLLALNAAVEAARAGEAGAGFAVVADEVRNLAIRAADAARNTASLIESTVKKVNEGGQLVARTNDDFSEVASKSGKVDELVSEIAAASNEQAQGIEQVNRAVAEMDKVTQQTAAIAEESSGASEEMSSQAVKMEKFVGQLIDIVGGSADQAKAAAKSEEASLNERRTTAAIPAHNPGRRRFALTGRKMGPEEMPPMDPNESLENF